MNLVVNSETSLANFTGEELKCYETWYKIIQKFSERYSSEFNSYNDHDIPKFGMITASFLKTSGIPKDILHDIWQIVDFDNKGLLRFSEFGNACRLISFYQHENLSPEKHLLAKTPLKLAYFNISRFWKEAEDSEDSEDSDKTEEPDETDKEDVNVTIDSYFSDALHISHCLKKFNDLDEKKIRLLDGTTIFNNYISSTLSRKELKQIWDFSDLDKDGKLSVAEFIIFNTLVKASKEKKINTSSGVSKKSMLIVINNIIEMDNEHREKAYNNISEFTETKLTQYNTSEDEIEKLKCEIERLNSEINDFKQAKDVLKCYKEHDDQQIIKLNEKKFLLITEHKDLIQNLNEQYSEIVKNRDLINYLYQDIKFLKETNNLLSNHQLRKSINVKREKISPSTNTSENILKINTNTENTVIEKCQFRKYNEWVRFPSSDRPVERSR